jgi:hypothetical protein
MTEEPTSEMLQFQLQHLGTKNYYTHCTTLLSGMSHVECLKLYNVLANTAVATFSVKVYWLGIFLETLYRAGSRQ